MKDTSLIDMDIASPPFRWAGFTFLKPNIHKKFSIFMLCYATMI